MIQLKGKENMVAQKEVTGLPTGSINIDLTFTARFQLKRSFPTI